MCLGHDSMTYAADAEYSPAIAKPMMRRRTNRIQKFGASAQAIEPKANMKIDKIIAGLRP